MGSETTYGADGWRNASNDWGVEFRYRSPDGVGDIAKITDVEHGCFTLWSNGELPDDVLLAGIKMALQPDHESDQRSDDDDDS